MPWVVTLNEGQALVSFNGFKDFHALPCLRHFQTRKNGPSLNASRQLLGWGWGSGVVKKLNRNLKCKGTLATSSILLTQ